MKRESSQDVNNGFVYINLLRPAKEQWKHHIEFDVEYPADCDVILPYHSMKEEIDNEVTVDGTQYRTRDRQVSNPVFRINNQKSAVKAGIAEYIMQNVYSKKENISEFMKAKTMKSSDENSKK